MTLRRLSLPFILSFLGMIFLPEWLPSVRFFAFIPFFIYVVLLSALPGALWSAFFVGMLYDIYAPGVILGLPSLVFILSILILYPYKNLFSEEKPHVLGLFAILFSLLITTLFFVARGVVGFPIRMHMIAVITDFFVMPILDGVYALTWVFYPIFVGKYFLAPARRLAIKQWCRYRIVEWKRSLWEKKYS